jgi:hypothetical protein
MTSHNGIYWLAPTQILATFAVAIALAIGHHYFYQHLSGQIAPTGSYTFGHFSMSKQQFNIAIGTAFAFAFKAVLAWALVSSYTQLFWRVVKTSLKVVRVGDADAAFSLLPDILAFSQGLNLAATVSRSRSCRNYILVSCTQHSSSSIDTKAANILQANSHRVHYHSGYFICAFCIDIPISDCYDASTSDRLDEPELLQVFV